MSEPTDASDYTDPNYTPPAIPLHDLLGFEVLAEIDGAPAGFTEVRLPVRPEAFGFTGNLHGGAIATLVDLACALAAVRASNPDLTQESMVTSDMHLRFIGRPRGANVVARAEVVRVGSQLIIIECKVVDAGGHVVATADVSMMRVSLRRPPQADPPTPS